MSQSHKNIKFEYNQAIEFQNLLLALYGQDKFYHLLEEDNLKFDSNMTIYLQKLKDKLSLYMQWELEYFFNMGEFLLYSFGRIIYMQYLIKNKQIKKVEELIQTIEKSDVMTFCRGLFLFHAYLNNNEVEIEKIEENVKTIKEMVTIVKNTKYQYEDTKQKVIECLENPEETKQRYCLFLKLFYQKLYISYEEKIIKQVLHKQSEYEKSYKDNPSQFTKDYFKTDLDVFQDTVCIHISYFWNIGFEYWPKRVGEELIILGINSDLTNNCIPTKDRVFHFLKTISDKSRLEILHLLSERPYYVNELAEKLKFSTATISYHLSRLQDLNIVDFKRREQRFYYFLIREELKELLSETSRLFLNE